MSALPFLGKLRVRVYYTVLNKISSHMTGTIVSLRIVAQAEELVGDTIIPSTLSSSIFATKFNSFLRLFPQCHKVNKII